MRMKPSCTAIFLQAKLKQKRVTAGSHNPTQDLQYVSGF